MILGIDPGTEQSAYVIWTGSEIYEKGIWPNERLVERVHIFSVNMQTYGENMVFAIEMPQCFGMPIGRDVLDTCKWVGRFIQAWKPELHIEVSRIDVKMHLCGTTRARDANIRQALIDRLGSPGTKRQPGLTHGIKRDMWQALAVAIYTWDTQFRKD